MLEAIDISSKTKGVKYPSENLGYEVNYKNKKAFFFQLYLLLLMPTYLFYRNALQKYLDFIGKKFFEIFSYVQTNTTIH